MKDDDEVVFMLEHDEYMRNFIISIVSPSSMEPDDLAACLITLSDDMTNHPEQFFKYKLATNTESH